jgi:hypothetical protein
MIHNIEREERSEARSGRGRKDKRGKRKEERGKEGVTKSRREGKGREEEKQRTCNRRLRISAASAVPNPPPTSSQ